jgi:MoaA/NifB/PqqE/SkfB family radical SAM enzyme
MSTATSILHHFKRVRTLQTHRVSALPVVILMPHSACNCRCVMCDIWKGNKNLKQLQPEDISALLDTLRNFGTRQVVLSGGEALLHPAFFRLCEIIHSLPIKITLLSTGVTLEKYAEQLVHAVDEIIVSLDGNETVHNRIRNIPNAFELLEKGVHAVNKLAPELPVSARTVIHRLNYACWPDIIEQARYMGLQQISFLPADVTSHAFNREIAWSMEKQEDILIPADELVELNRIIESIIHLNWADFKRGFIAESPDKLRLIATYYGACHSLNPFPYKKCNAPWVSTVVEADGTVRPCFFHNASGNIHQQKLDEILNSPENISFRKNLDTKTNSTCEKCVCSLYLSPGTKLNA